MSSLTLDETYATLSNVLYDMLPAAQSAARAISPLDPLYPLALRITELRQPQTHLCPFPDLLPSHTYTHLPLTSPLRTFLIAANALHN